MPSKMLSKRSEIDTQLRDLMNRHGFDQRCAGWGSTLVLGHMPVTCVDCGLPGVLRFGDDVRCWRCGFWTHFPNCPHAERLIRPGVPSVR